MIGVVANVRAITLDREPGYSAYVPYWQEDAPFVALALRTDTEDPATLSSAVRKTIHEIDPDLPIAGLRTMDAVVDRTVARPRIVAVLLTAFAVMALALAAVGVYGVMAYSVAQRTQEIGVRMALGATTDSIFGMVIGDAFRLVGIGVAVGLICAAGLTRLLTTLLYETKPLDPVTFIVTAVLLTVVAMSASVVPARRGTRIAPNQALRAE